MNFKQSILIALIAFASQAHGYEHKDGSTFAFADLLIWKLSEGGAEDWAQEISPAGTVQTANIDSVPFNWKYGFRAGIGRNLIYDAWDTVFTYTYYQSKTSSQAAMTTGGISSPFAANFYVNNTNGATITLDPTYRNASVQWNFYFNNFDLELGRRFIIDQFLTLRPFIGLKSAIINQDINTFWQNPTNASNFTNATENLKNNFWGIGPALGLNSTWNVYRAEHRAFNLIGNFSGALLWGNWRFKDVYTNNRPSTVSVSVKSINGASSMVRGLLGVEWTGCYAKTNFSVRLGYEAQVWFDQVQYYSYSMGRLNSLMSLQGGVFGFGINF